MKNLKKKNLKVVVGLSGGVDSSVALLLLKKQGYQPIGVSLRYAAWSSSKNILKENVCCAEASFEIARQVCQKLKVPYHLVDCRPDFEKKVMGYFLTLLKNKETPNPCVICNRLVKFEQLFKFAKAQGAKYVATGHYARINKDSASGRYQLGRAKDEYKDQSYFLCLLTQKQLKNLIFPLGNYRKEQVYQLAQKESFGFFTKIKQSQDLCFIAQQSLTAYLEEEIGFEPGKITNKKGKILGTHQGLHFYTFGQRKGIGLEGGPWWVLGFDREKNRLIVTDNENDPSLSRRTILLKDYNFVSGKVPRQMIKVQAKTRLNQSLAPAKLFPPKKKIIKLFFDKAQRAITPGQWAVFYQDDICLGGGVIVDKKD